MKLITVLTPCYNEEENVREVYERVKTVFETTLKDYDYEHLFIDNASLDRTVTILKDIAHTDKRVRLIVNARNFGQIRSPMHALFQARGDAVIGIVADLQDPPEMIAEYVAKWEEGYKIVIGVKRKTEDTPLFSWIRHLYYELIHHLSDVDQVKNATGSGLYDRTFVDIVKKMDDPYPYFRGLIGEIGFERAEIPYDQPIRKRGITKNNFYTLYDMAMLGITNYSKIPLRLAVFTGFGIGCLSLLTAFIYFIYKLLFWKSFQVGMAPLVIGIFFFSAVQLFFIGILGEYIGAIHTQVLKRPLVVEKERINFD